MADFPGASVPASFFGVSGDGYFDPDMPGEHMPIFAGAVLTPPTIVFDDPGAVLDVDDPITVHVTSEGIALVVITFDYSSPNRHDLAFLGDVTSDGFDGDYDAASTATAITGGCDYVVAHDTGWRGPFTMQVTVTDASGTVVTESSTFTMASSHLPQVLNVSPTAGTLIENTTPIFFRTHDATGLLIEFIYAEIRGVQELVWDGSNFTLNYAGSDRDVVTPDRTFDYEVVRAGGWPTPPRITAKLFDLDGITASPSWSYLLAAAPVPEFGINTDPTSIEFSKADIYDALFQSVGDGLQAEPGSIVEAWREAKADGLQVATRDARAALQAFPNRATDFLAMYEDLLGIQPAADATIEERQAAAALRYTQVIDATGPSVQAMLTDVDPDLELFSVPFEHTVTTEMGVRAFEDWDPDAPGASGPVYNALTGKTHTIVPNYSSLFKVYVLLNAVGAVTETQKRAMMTAGGVLSDALPAWVDFTIFRNGGFTLDTDLLDLTVFADGLTVP